MQFMQLVKSMDLMYLVLDMQVMEIAGQGHPPLLHTDGIPEAIERFLAKIENLNRRDSP